MAAAVFTVLVASVLGLVARLQGTLQAEPERADLQQRTRVAVEQVALNVIDSDRPDNRGARHQATPIVKSAPLALEAPWDAHLLARRLNERGVAASVSRG